MSVNDAQCKTQMLRTSLETCVRQEAEAHYLKWVYLFQFTAKRTVEQAPPRALRGQKSLDLTMVSMARLGETLFGQDASAIVMRRGSPKLLPCLVGRIHDSWSQWKAMTKCMSNLIHRVAELFTTNCSRSRRRKSKGDYLDVSKVRRTSDRRKKLCWKSSAVETAQSSKETRDKKERSMKSKSCMNGRVTRWIHQTQG